MDMDYLNDSGLSYFWSKIKSGLSGKQDTLVSGTNIKTVNGNSLLGSGDLTTPAASSTAPKVDGTADVGTETSYARGDHVHPHDTTKANLASPTFTGTPKAPTAAAGTNTTQLATTAFVTTAVNALKNTVTVKTISSTSTANGSDATIGNTGSLAAGTYAITYQAWWNSNATGRRSVYLATSSSGSEWDGTRLTVAPPSGGGLSIRGFLLVTLTAATTLYMRTYQNSGAALNAGGRFEILKLH